MITTNSEKSPKMKKGVLTTHDLPNPPKPEVKKNRIITTNSPAQDYVKWKSLLPDEPPDRSGVPLKRMPGWNKMPWGRK